MRIGTHLNKPYGTALERYTAAVGNGAIELVGQIFVLVPRGGADIDLSTDTIRTSAARTYVHANYLTQIGDLSKPHIRRQLVRIAEFGFAGLVIHLTNIGYQKIVTNARAIVEMNRAIPNHRPVIFEITPGKYDGLGVRESVNFDTAAKLMAFVADVGYSPADYGICIDTAHLWSYGQNIRFSSQLRDWFAGFDPRWLKLIHLNDSKSALGGPDEHDVIGYGKIWPINDQSKFKFHRFAKMPPEHQPSFMWMVDYAKQYGIDIITERSGTDISMITQELNALIAII